MTVLAERQRAFMDALYAQRDEPASGMDVYRRAVAANLHDALAATYPVVRRLVGEAFFREAARNYSSAHPSRSADLHEYGAHFPAFLGAYRHAQALPYLADVARLEWACHECLLAGESAAFDFEALRSVKPEDQAQLRFALHPAVRLVLSAHPVAAIREANQPGGDGCARGEGPDHLLVTREEGQARVSRLDPREWDFLAAIARGAILEEASLAFDEAEGEALALALRRQVQAGVIAGFALGAP